MNLQGHLVGDKTLGGWGGPNSCLNPRDHSSGGPARPCKLPRTCTGKHSSIESVCEKCSHCLLTVDRLEISFFNTTLPAAMSKVLQVEGSLQFEEEDTSDSEGETENTTTNDPPMVFDEESDEEELETFNTAQENRDDPATKEQVSGHSNSCCAPRVLIFS